MSAAPQPATLLDLPDELLSPICATVTSGKDISSLMQTCRRLYAVAEPFLFSSISYRNRISQPSLLAALQKEAQRPLWVRELRLDYYPYNVCPLDNEPDLLSMIPSFVNLEKLELDYRMVTVTSRDRPEERIITESRSGLTYPLTEDLMIDVFKGLFADNAVTAEKPLKDAGSIASLESSAPSCQAPNLPPSPAVLGRLRYCTIRGEPGKSKINAHILRLVLLSGSLRSLTLMNQQLRRPYYIDDMGGQRTSPLQELVLENCTIDPDTFRQILDVPRGLQKLVFSSFRFAFSHRRVQEVVDAVRLHELSLHDIDWQGCFIERDSAGEIHFEHFKKVISAHFRGLRV